MMAPCKRQLKATRHLNCGSCSNWVDFVKSGCEKSSAEVQADSFSFECRGCTKMKELEVELEELRLLVVAMVVGRQDVRRRKGTGGKTTGVKERGVGETGGKEKGVGDTGGKTTGAKERGVAETGGKEKGVGETGGKTTGVGETGGKTTGVKERGVGETGGTNNVEREGASSLPAAIYFSQPLNSVVVPESIPVGSEIVRLYVLKSPTPKMTSSVMCRIGGLTVGISGEAKAGEFSEDDCPFGISNTSLWLYVRLPLNDSFQLTEPTIYNVDVECHIPDAMISDDDSRVSTVVTIVVCDDSVCRPSSQPARGVNLTDPDKAQHMCFGDHDELSFEVYENSGPSVLGTVNSMLAVVGYRTGGVRRQYVVRQTEYVVCQTGEAFIREYVVRQSDVAFIREYVVRQTEPVSSNISVDNVTGELNINGPLDREVVSEVHLTVDCRLRRQNATDNATVVSKPVTILVRDVDDNGPTIKNRFGPVRDVEETQVELGSLTQAQRKNGTELLKYGAFREEFTLFLVEELNKPHHWPIIGQYTYHMEVNAMKTNKGELLHCQITSKVDSMSPTPSPDTLTRHPHPTPSPGTLTRHPHSTP
ncbi:hypothetical protein LSAT2_023970 [Lamellibrachia satsuma]|nr:hypothetical protein LSAT2_023970 [Lamellibrachia satsuma]